MVSFDSRVAEQRARPSPALDQDQDDEGIADDGNGNDAEDTLPDPVRLTPNA
jgi:hypothetical protein